MGERRSRLVDVREPSEFAAGYIEGSELVPLARLQSECGKWSQQDKVTLVCRSGRRAEEGRRQLLAKGFADVVVLPGGVEAWRADGKPLVVPEGKPAQGRKRTLIITAVAISISLVLAYFVSHVFLAVAAFMAIRLVVPT